MKYSKEKLLFDLCMLDKNLPIKFQNKYCNYMRAFKMHTDIYMNFGNIEENNMYYAFDLKNLMLNYPEYGLKLTLIDGYPVAEYFITKYELKFEIDKKYE